MSFIPLFLQQQTQPGSPFGMIIPLIFIVLIMYFFMIRPQSKKQKEMQKLLDSLEKGDKVVTIGGIHGKISSVKEKSVVLEIDDNVKVEFNKTAIATVVNKINPPADKKSKKEKKGSAEKSTDIAAEITESGEAKNE